MPRKFIKRHVPNAAYLHKNSGLSFLGDHLHRPNLWHLNRRSIAKAFAIGLFSMWLPIPFQTILAALLAIIFCANLPLSVILVFITNPLTIPFMFYFSYRVGAWLLGIPCENMNFAFSLEWLGDTIGNSWRPLLLGSLAMGIISSLLGYIAIRILWRIHILKQWQCRRRQRRKKHKKSKT